jgi:hypothetical protein
MSAKVNIKRGMTEAFAVTGYVPEKALQDLESGSTANIDVRVERGSNEVVMRVDQADIAEIRAGASVKKEILVQVILHANARVETVVRAQANSKGVARFNDPLLQRLTATAMSNASSLHKSQNRRYL